MKSATLSVLTGAIKGVKDVGDGNSEVVRGEDHFSKMRTWASSGQERRGKEGDYAGGGTSRAQISLLSSFDQ